MRLGPWTPALLGLLTSIRLVDGLVDDPCPAFQNYDHVCLWYPDEGNQVYSCDASDFVYGHDQWQDPNGVFSNPTTQTLCHFWVRRSGIINDDTTLWHDHYGYHYTTTDDDNTDSDPITPRQAPIVPPASPTPGQAWIPHDTRCNPTDKTKIQVFRHGWYPVHDCPAGTLCLDISRSGQTARAGCDLGDGTYDVPDPHDWEPVKRSKRSVAGMPPLIPAFDSRCDPNGTNDILRVKDGQWVHAWHCGLNTPCYDLAGMGACKSSDAHFYIPAVDPLYPRGHAQKRDEPPPNLHSFDTRCNPLNLSEVQRYDGYNWVLHSVCMLKDSCKDVKGIGSCYMGNNMYILPAANDTIDLDHPLGSAPLIDKRRCNPDNNTQTQAWTLNGWTPDGVCFDPYVCEDFSNAGFAVCAEPSAVNRSIWLPWKPFNAPPIYDRRVSNTKCKDNHELLRRVGANWVHDSMCVDGWACRTDGKEPPNAGCYAPSVAHVDFYQSQLGFVRRDPESDTSDDDNNQVFPNGGASVAVNEPPSFIPTPRFEGMHARRVAGIAKPHVTDTDAPGHDD